VTEALIEHATETLTSWDGQALRPILVVAACIEEVASRGAEPRAVLGLCTSAVASVGSAVVTAEQLGEPDKAATLSALYGRLHEINRSVIKQVQA